MTMLSIVIPTYQRGAMLEDALHNYVQVLINAAQKSGVDFEVVVVDDCSSDGTFECLSKFEKNMIFLNIFVCLKMQVLGLLVMLAMILR